MKTKLSILLMAIGLVALSCQKNANGKVIIEGAVSETDSYGGLHLSFSSDEMEAAGVGYGDLLEVSIGDLVVETPYVDAYTEAGSMSPCLCNYNRGGGDNFSLSMSNGSFANHIGGKADDKIVVRMKEKEGYLKEYSLLQGVYTYEREDYSSDEVFANFREITTTGITLGVLYRSTSPISYEKNKVRYTYAANLCQQKGIQTIIDIADNEEKIHTYLAAKESEGSYMLDCQQRGNIVGVGSNADYLDSVFMSKLATAMRGMIARPAPYLIHCNEGKDRTGFYCILLEALCGATIEEMKTDYMATFVNLYHQTKGSEQYELTWSKNGYRMLYSIANPDSWTNVKDIEWNQISVDETILSAAAAKYLQTAGLSMEEVDQLKSILTK